VKNYLETLRTKGMWTMKDELMIGEALVPWGQIHLICYLYMNVLPSLTKKNISIYV